MSSDTPFHIHSSKGFGIATPVPSATAAANIIRQHGGGIFDMYLAALACAWVTDPANCSPFGRMQGVFSVSGETGSLNAPTAVRFAAESTVPVPGNIAAWYSLKRSGRLRLPASALVAPATALAQQGFAPSEGLKIALESQEGVLDRSLNAIYLENRGEIRKHIQNPQLANLLRILGESESEDDFWQTLRARDPGPWHPEETLENRVRQPTPRMLDLDLDGRRQRLLTTGAVETWGTWILLGAAVTVELRRREALRDFSRAMEAYVLSTILLLDRIPFAVGTLEPKIRRPSVDIDISSEAIAIADRVIRLLDAPVESLWEQLGATYFPGPDSWTDDTNTNHFAIATGDDFLSFTTSIGPWFGSKASWFGAALGYSYAMKSNLLFEGQTHDVTEMSPLIVEMAGRPMLAIGSAGSERILGSLTYLLFLRIGLGFREDMADLLAKPRVFPKDGKLRMHLDFWPDARAHLEARGFKISPSGYDPHTHIGMVNAVERLDNESYKSGADPSSSGSAL
ncbi:gamma-glutamyltranspeptidase [Rhizobium sp. SEMIA 4085]|uniref:Gamma-glutamyltranspeptidase protein n=1 Tax=Rhizobium gallicum bv. gallicum R602sp TaxID=1041138 RepID=A0A0B4XBB0_9HYPH|nr:MULTISPECIES: gamma-glutamyltransferase [Rhizobium]AJD43883.1 gamma-glutamyltranspeptidase protein [Rhizobium gallicum bv. gallicum R602sp]NNH32225.1 gamma-glutamyltranspeptidase [Rhizobium sp. SEMIA 4085]TDW16907.1 gamma-glutamyltranspeptidase/glutathione hydrolase [Rhizobium azibense]